MFHPADVLHIRETQRDPFSIDTLCQSPSDILQLSGDLAESFRHKPMIFFYIMAESCARRFPR